MLTPAFPGVVHYNLPDAIQPMRNKNHAHFVTLAAMALSLTFFVAIGVVCALTFGPRVGRARKRGLCGRGGVVVQVCASSMVFG